MSPQEIDKYLSMRPGKARVVEVSNTLAIDPANVRYLIDMSFHIDRDIAFRAAWTLETLVINHPLAVINEVEYLISKIKDVTHASCQRHYAKMMAYLTSAKMPLAIKEKTQTIDMEPVVEKCFDWMIDPQVLVAVKVFAAETLFNLRHRYPFINDELPEQLKYLMRDGTAAIQSRGKKLLAMLTK